MDDCQAAADRVQSRYQELRDKCQHLSDIVDRVQRLAEALAADTDPSRREVATELIEIVGVPE